MLLYIYINLVSNTIHVFEFLESPRPAPEHCPLHRLNKGGTILVFDIDISIMQKHIVRCMYARSLFFSAAASLFVCVTRMI